LVSFGGASTQAFGLYLAPPKETNLAPAAAPKEHSPTEARLKKNSLKEGEEENTPGAQGAWIRNGSLHPAGGPLIGICKVNTLNRRRPHVCGLNLMVILFRGEDRELFE
jgi:hypothetical protein